MLILKALLTALFLSETLMIDTTPICESYSNGLRFFLLFSSLLSSQNERMNLKASGLLDKMLLSLSSIGARMEGWRVVRSSEIIYLTRTRCSVGFDYDDPFR